MQSSINRDGFFPPDPDELVAEGEPPFADAASATAREKAEHDLDLLQHEVRLLRARLGILREDAESALKARANLIDASAHVQLGSYPWAKLALATGAAFIAARIVRSLPFGVLLAGFAGQLSETRRW